MQLENFGVDTAALQEPTTTRRFWAWFEDWEDVAVHSNDCVAKAQLRAKYQDDLVFYDPDDRVIRSIYSKNLCWVKKLKELQALKIGGFC